MYMAFEYDPRKAQTNRQKHGIPFADAELVFFDTLAIYDIENDQRLSEYVKTRAS
jgi:uncharacterized DUF497 family protein